jgi:hypothetical protein
MRTEHLLRPIRTLDIPLPAHGRLLMLLSVPVGFPLGTPGVTRTRSPPYAVKLTHSRPTSASSYGSTGPLSSPVHLDPALLPSGEPESPSTPRGNPNIIPLGTIPSLRANNHPATDRDRDNSDLDRAHVLLPPSLPSLISPKKRCPIQLITALGSIIYCVIGYVLSATCIGRSQQGTNTHPSAPVPPCVLSLASREHWTEY